MCYEIVSKIHQNCILRKKNKGMKIRNYIGLLVMSLFAITCSSDDDDVSTFFELRDRGEQSVMDDEMIKSYLQTHFYNYEEFEAPTAEFDFKIVFDTIAGDNLDKIPLIEQVTDTTYHRFDTNNTLYKLTVRPGQGDMLKSTFVDSVFMNLKGVNLSGGTFENIENPVWFDLVETVDGFMHGLSNVRGGSGFAQNNDGTISFNNDYEIGAIFIPSGLGFFASPPGNNIPLYSTLVFTYDVFDVEISDHDNDGVITILEDIDGNGVLTDDIDNTDDDTIFNFADTDDDGDGVLTDLEISYILETVTNQQGEVLEVEVFDSFLDTDNDGISDHLDNDDDNDGKLTIDEIEINNNTGVIAYPDTDNDGIPDYLDSDS